MGPEPSSPASFGAPRLLGVVFAGGASARMGADKATLRWPTPDGGRVTLVERAALTLDRLCPRVEIAAGALPDDAWPDRPTFEDVEPGQGPLAGLVAALERARERGLDGVLALACDMPLVGPDELQPLVDALRGSDGVGEVDAAMWVVDGRDQPLCAAYRTSCAGPGRRAFDAGARRLVAIFDESAAEGRPLRLERRIADENSSPRLVNVNTPTDYDRALRRAEGPAAEAAPSQDPDRPAGSER